MPLVAICPYNGSTIDISAVRYANVSILDNFDTENANTENFPGTYELISNLLEDYGQYKRGAVFIATKAGQRFSDMTDCIRFTDSGNGVVTCTVFKNGAQYGGSTGVFAYAPWTVFRNTFGQYGVVGLSSNGSRVVAVECDYISSSTSLTDIIPDGDITIRCPDSVRQGLFIIVACDSPVQPYVDFTCTLSGHTSDKTFLMQNTDKTLRLQCGSDEGAGELLLEVESGGATASKAIKVIPYTPVGPGSGDNEYDTESRVTDISLLAFPDTVAPGGYSIILISVNGEGDYSQRITAEISGHTSADTQVFSDGYFCNIAVGKDETAESVLVTITSAQDPAVSSSVSVNVDHSNYTPIDPGTNEEKLQRAFWKGYAAAKALCSILKKGGIEVTEADIRRIVEEVIRELADNGQIGGLKQTKTWLLPEQSFVMEAIADGADEGMFGGTFTPVGETLPEELCFIVNGVVYKSKKQTLEHNADTVGWYGNAALFSPDDFEESPEPFFAMLSIDDSSFAGGIINPDTGGLQHAGTTHTFGIYILEESTTPISDKYLPGVCLPHIELVGDFQVGKTTLSEEMAAKVGELVSSLPHAFLATITASNGISFVVLFTHNGGKVASDGYIPEYIAHKMFEEGTHAYIKINRNVFNENTWYLNYTTFGTQ